MRFQAHLISSHIKLKFFKSFLTQLTTHEPESEKYPQYDQES